VGMFVSGVLCTFPATDPHGWNFLLGGGLSHAMA
jgi:hypothetical protein